MPPKNNLTSNPRRIGEELLQQWFKGRVAVKIRLCAGPAHLYLVSGSLLLFSSSSGRAPGVSQLLLPCVCILSLPRLAAVCICPLEPREGHRGWNLLPTDKKQGTEGFRAQEPHGVLFSFRGSKCYYVDWRAAEI